jgi:hypothetical protein
MAVPILRGPYRLASAVIGIFVPAGMAGVYLLGALSQGKLHPVDAVGRAERDLADTLMGLIGSNSGFMFAPASSPPEAFEMECRVFHDNMLSGRRPHPMAPPDTPLVCPVCGSRG